MSLVNEYEDFKQKTTDILNEYVNKIPAVFLADFYGKLELQLRDVSKTQTIEESEDKNNGR